MDPLTIAGIGSGLAGLFGGLFHSTPQYSDIDLAKDNPELYKQIQANQNLLNQANAAYQARRTGATQSELQARGQAQADMNNQLASRGLLGTSYGMNTAADSSNKLNAGLQDRIYQEQLGLMQNAQQQGQSVYNQTAQAQQAIMAAKQGQASQQAGLFGGLATGGLGLIGSGLTQGANAANNASWMQQFGGTPGNYGYGSMPNYQIQMPQFGSSVNPGYNYGF